MLVALAGYSRSVAFSLLCSSDRTTPVCDARPRIDAPLSPSPAANPNPNPNPHQVGAQP